MQRKKFFRTMAGRMAGMLVVVASLLGTAQAQFGGIFSGNESDKPIKVSSFPANVQQEYKLFQNKCSECHTTAKALQHVQTPDLAKFWVLQMQAMSAADITDKQATEIIDFINNEQLHQPKKQPSETGSGMTTSPTDKVAILAGKEFFNTEMCGVCHSTGVSNDPTLVPLANISNKLSREKLIGVLHGEEVSFGMPALPASTSLNDLNNLVAYLQSLQGQ